MGSLVSGIVAAIFVNVVTVCMLFDCCFCVCEYAVAMFDWLFECCCCVCLNVVSVLCTLFECFAVVVLMLVLVYHSWY